MGNNECVNRIATVTLFMPNQPSFRYHQMLVSPHVGGGARIAMAIHQHVVATRGPIAHLLLPGGAEAESMALRASMPFTRYRLDRLTGPSRFASAYENLRLFRETIRHDHGIIHIHAPFVFGAARTFLFLSRLKSILHVHLDFTVKQLRWALRFPPDLVLLCAEFMRPAVEEALNDTRAMRTCVRVVPNAIDTRVFFAADRATSKRSLGLDDRRPLLAVIANLAPHKGQETAVRAVAALKQIGITVGLWIVGSERSRGEDYLGYLQKLCEELRIGDQVEFVGFRKDTAEILRAADFVLLPSISEGLPLVILEAQASKALVLAAPTAGIPEVIEHGTTGFLIDAHDSKAYAECIAQLLRDPARANAVIENAWLRVREHHEIHRYCNRILHEYDALLATR